MERLLVWHRYGDTHHTYSDKASAIVYPCQGGGFYWEIFLGAEAASWHGQVETLHSAMSHVEGNFIGRNLRSDLAVEIKSAC